MHCFYKGPAMSVAFSKQGDYFASGGQDQQVENKKYPLKNLVWDLILRYLFGKPILMLILHLLSPPIINIQMVMIMIQYHEFHQQMYSKINFK